MRGDQRHPYAGDYPNMTISTSVMVPAMTIAISASAKNGLVASDRCQRKSRKGFTSLDLGNGRREFAAFILR